MKYDSGMTHFHKDIIAALQHMLGNNSEITKKFSSNDGSPAPLRDYLKEKYGKSYTSHIGNGVRYSCKTSTGFDVLFDHILNNPGDKNLTLSWSQTAKFIRDNWDEIFKKDKPKSRPLETLVRTFDEEAMTCPNWVRGKTLTYLEKVNGVHFECQAFSAEFCKLDDITKFFVQHCNCHENCPYYKETAEKQPSYLDKLREKYPKISIEDEWVWGDYCPADIFKGEKVPDSCTDLCGKFKSDDSQSRCEKCWNSPCATDVTFDNDLDMFEEDYFGQYPAEDTAEADAVPEISEDTAETDKPKPKPTYKDVLLEHYPDFDESRFDDFASDVCVAVYFNDIGEVIDCANVNNNCKKCWYSECILTWDITEEGENDIKPYLKTRPSSADTETDDPPENQIIPKDTSEISNTFNYSVLSTEMGDYLKNKEQQLKNEYMNFTANCGAIFAEAQERLAKHGFGENNGLFEKWIVSIGFSKPTVYRMIEVHKFRSSQIETNGEAELFDSLSKSLQYEIAKPSAPAELVEQVLSGDITTHKDYIKLKAELDRTREECRQLDANSAAKDKEYERQLEEANERAKKAEKRADSSHRDFLEQSNFASKLASEKFKLEEQIKELENRPVDVAVQQDETSLAEIARLKNELAKAQQDIIDASFESGKSGDTELVSEFYETLHGSALSAIRSCADFAEKNGSKFIGRFRSLAEVINDYINEMEEF